MTDLSPREIVSELDRHIVAQSDAKRAVAIALRGRWRRQRVDEDLRDEITPKNILMIGPTGVGKTEISRRLAKLAKAPFIKVEATKFTEVGYVGRDVEQIIRDLVEAALVMIRETRREDVRAAAEVNAEARILDVLVGESAGESTRAKFREKLIRGELDDKEVEIEMDDSPSMPSFDIPGQPGASMGMIDLSSLLGKGMRPRRKVKMKIADAYEPLLAEESDKLLDEDGIKRDALKLAEQNGIVFLDEIDKITSRSENGTSASVSREGVQRDLLPLIEGTTVSTKYGPIKTDHILFIASGAFHVARPSDLLPELQGRLPIRVELRALTEEDFVRILTEPEASLITQYIALMKTEEVELEFTEDAIAQLAKLSAEINSTIENIGARRLHTVMERLLDDISFSASDKSGEKLVIDADYVNDHVGGLLKSTDLSKFIL